MNTINDKKMKERDSKNRRQLSRGSAMSFHDISCARYFEFGGSKYILRSRQWSDDYAVYSLHDDAEECIGYAKPDRNKMTITVHHHGLDWSVKIPLSEITCYGNKLPRD